MNWLFTQSIACIKHELLFITLHDCIEIIFITSIIYFFLRWLSQDHQKNLVLWFYAYVTITACTYAAHLPTLYCILTIGSPLFLLFFIIVHQHTLQKNFISLKNITVPEPIHYNWLDITLQASCFALNKKKEVICIIERKNSLQQFFIRNYLLNAPITKELLEFLINALPDEQSITFLISHTGHLTTINPFWKTLPNSLCLSEEIKNLPSWKQNSLTITEKTDALIFTITPETRLFSIIVEGTLINNITLKDALTLIKKYSATTKTERKKHEYLFTRNTTQQKFFEN